MAVPKKVINFLENSKVKYNLISHRTVYTAFDKSATLKVPEKKVGKTVVVKINNNDLCLVLIGSDKILDISKLKKVLKKIFKNSLKKISFASEKLIGKKLKGVKVGAIPPFGDLWKIKTIVDSSFLKQKTVILNSGDYNFSFEIKTKDLKKLIPDLIKGNFTKKRPKKKTKKSKKSK